MVAGRLSLAMAPKAKRTNWRREVGDPYGEGAEAAGGGVLESANPYDPKTAQHSYVEWREGWRCAVADKTID